MAGAQALDVEQGDDAPLSGYVEPLRVGAVRAMAQKGPNQRGESSERDGRGMWGM